MNRHRMIRKIDAITDLPTLPTVAMAVNRMLQDVDSPIDQLVALLERDQSMVLKILRLVNSSFYGFKSRITSLRHAVTLMGYTTVQHAVVTVAVIDCLKIKATLKGFDISCFWTHSIGTAVMCRHLAARTRLAAPDEAFTAGLVHDIGKVVLANHFPDVFVSLMEAASTEKSNFHTAESRRDTYPHNLIGGNLARRWMLPEALILAIRNHHGGMAPTIGGTLPGLVAVADTLVNMIDQLPGYHLGPGVIPEAVSGPVTGVLKDSAGWFPEVKREMAAACDFFIKG
jgi:putative nucleotidyltransferase with HDIG domain